MKSRVPNAPRDAKGKPLDGVPFHPYYTVHDIFGVSVFLLAFSAVVFFAPEFGGYFLRVQQLHPRRSAGDAVAHCSRVVLHPFYSMLRAITSEMMYALIACVLLGALFGVLKAQLPAIFKVVIAGGAVVVTALMLAIDAKFWGVVVMGGAVIILFLPALAGLRPCEVHSLPSRLAQVLLRCLCDQLPDLGLPGRPASLADW